MSDEKFVHAEQQLVIMIQVVQDLLESVQRMVPVARDVVDSLVRVGNAATDARDAIRARKQVDSE